MRKGETVVVTRVKSLRHIWMLGRRAVVRGVRGETVGVLVGKRYITLPVFAVRPLGHG